MMKTDSHSIAAGALHRYAKYLTLLCLFLILVGCAGTVESIRGGVGKIFKTGQSAENAQSSETSIHNTSTSPNPSVEPTQAIRSPQKSQFDASLVLLIQTKLKKLNYDPGSVDGQFGPKTEAAIQDFQLDNDLAIDGKPTQSLLRVVNSKNTK